MEITELLNHTEENFQIQSHKFTRKKSLSTRKKIVHEILFRNKKKQADPWTASIERRFSQSLCCSFFRINTIPSKFFEKDPKLKTTNCWCSKRRRICDTWPELKQQNYVLIFEKYQLFLHNVSRVIFLPTFGVYSDKIWPCSWCPHHSFRVGPSLLTCNQRGAAWTKAPNKGLTFLMWLMLWM